MTAPAPPREYSGDSADALLSSMPDRLARLVERRAMSMPDHPALACGSKTITYGEFWSAICTAKRLLTSSGVVGGDRVMIVNENSISAVVFIFAATDLDAWASPINARMSGREIDACRAFADCRITICHDRRFRSRA